MKFVGSWPVASRRVLVVLGVVALLVATSGVRAQQAGAAPQQAPAADQLKFAGDIPGMVFYQIKPEKTADFESAWAAVRAAFGKATNADLKAFGDTLTKMFKVDLSLAGITVPAGSPAVYVLQLDMPSKTTSYNPIKIIYETLWNNGKEGGVLNRAEADAIYEKMKDCFLGINPMPLVKVGG